MLASEGHHYAFEPLPHLANVLRLTFPAVNVYSCALGNREEITQFHHALDAEAWSGLRLQKYPKTTREEMLLVEVRKLDNVIPEQVAIHFIKIDVEGAELPVLAGGLQLLRRCKPYLIFECAHIHLANYGYTPAALFEFLTSKLACSFSALVIVESL